MSIQDVIIGFEEAPRWAQVAMAFAAVFVVYAMLEKPIRRLTYRRRFRAFARALGQQPPVERGWPTTFSIDNGSRSIEIRHDFRTSFRGSSYRGPLGHLLIVSTRLAGTKWEMHSVDISRLTRLAGLLASRVKSGDAEFDGRFMVVEDGVLVRDHWLDAPTRQEIARFFDHAPAKGVIWIHNAELQFIMYLRWPEPDAAVMRALLDRQTALASALEATAAKRW
jgi:hypothetical protein